MSWITSFRLFFIDIVSFYLMQMFLFVRNDTDTFMVATCWISHCHFAGIFRAYISWKNKLIVVFINRDIVGFIESSCDQEKPRSVAVAIQENVAREVVKRIE